MPDVGCTSDAPYAMINTRTRLDSVTSVVNCEAQLVLITTATRLDSVTLVVNGDARLVMIATRTRLHSRLLKDIFLNLLQKYTNNRYYKKTDQS